MSGDIPLDTLSTSSASIINNHLFNPFTSSEGNDRNSNQNELADIASIDSSSSSVRQLRNMFNKTSAKTNIEESDIHDDISDIRTFNEELFDQKYSLQSSVIDQIALSGTTNIHDEVADAINEYEDERFNYLRQYEQQLKSNKRKTDAKSTINQMKNNQEIPLQIMKTNQSSVFELSHLDDFNKYVKQTELNEMIHAQVMEKRKGMEATNELNVLNVVEGNQFFEDFYGGEDAGKSKVVKQKQSWSKKFFKDDVTMNSSTKRPSKLKPNKEPNTRQAKEKEANIDTKHPPTDDLYLEDLSSINSSLSVGQTNYLQRKLKVRHLQMISFGGTLGVGLFLNSGKALTIAGGFGTLLAFVLCGLVVLCTIMSFCEMVTFISVVDGVSGLSSRFVDDAFGFAVGWLYWASFAFGLAGEIVASVIMLAYYPSLDITTNKGLTVGFVTLFLIIILLINLIDVRIFGEIEYFSSLLKLILVMLMIIFMIVLNVGGFHGTDKNIGFKYWLLSKSDVEHNLMFGLFRPSFNLHDDGTNSPADGIGGNIGRFLSLMTAIMVVAYAYSGTEIVCIAACEAQNPRKALPSATKRVFWRIIIFYCLSAFVVSLNVYAGDPRLLRYYSGDTGIDVNQFSTNYAILYAGGANCNSEAIVYAGFGSGAQSPWIVALQSVGLCELSSVVNGFLVFFAVSCGNSQLYVSSRTLYSLALQNKAPKFLTTCNRFGIPYNSVLFSASFGLLSFICISEQALVVFQNLTSLIASSGVLVWFAMCLSYIRFFYGLKRRPDIINRDDKSYPYRSPFQPYSAMFGLFGSSVIIIGMGFVVFLKDEWDTMFFFSSYGTFLVFAVLYFGYKFIRGTRIPSLDTLDFDSGRTEMDRYIWDGGRDYNIRNFKDVMQKWLSVLA